MLFALCIHTRAGRPGDTQNGGTCVTTCAYDGEMEGWGWIVELARKQRGNTKKKKKGGADGWEETRRCNRTYRGCSGQTHQRGQDTKKHCQHALSSGSQQIKVRTEWQRHRAATSEQSPDAESLERSSVPRTPAAHTDKDRGQDSLDLHQDEQKRSAQHTHGGWCTTGRTQTCRIDNKHLYHSSGGKHFIKIKNKESVHIDVTRTMFKFGLFTEEDSIFVFRSVALCT